MGKKSTEDIANGLLTKAAIKFKKKTSRLPSMEGEYCEATLGRWVQAMSEAIAVLGNNYSKRKKK